jgi:flavin-dependent dehydrogenase
MQLGNGSQVVIVGGGPAGTFTALHLLYQASKAHKNIEITILEARDFSRPGPGGCNKCAGILSSKLIKNMESLDLQLPAEVIQSELQAYVLHLGDEQLLLHPPDPAKYIMSVYRGGGPRLGSLPYPHSFDDWLLNQARARGANILRMRVRAILPGSRPKVVTAHQEFEPDLVIVATGVNSRSPLDPVWRYRPPHTEIMAQDELPLPASLLDNCVHIFFDYPKGLIFGGLTPKGRYTNISLLGQGLPADAVKYFLGGHGLELLLSENPVSLCGCNPHVTVLPAKGYFADRLVVVGDAAVTRLYKDGIGAAFVTAQAVARTAIQRGISRRDFAMGYRPVCLRIARDNFYGRILFLLWAFTRRSRFLRETWMRAIWDEVNRPSSDRILTSVLWSMFTGDESYRKIFWRSFGWPALWRLFYSGLQTLRG